MGKWIFIHGYTHYTGPFPPETPQLNPWSISQCQPICLPRVIHSQDLDSIFFPCGVFEFACLLPWSVYVYSKCLDSDISPFVMLTLHIYVCELVQPVFSGLFCKIAGSFTSCHTLNQQTNSNVTCNWCGCGLNSTLRGKKMTKRYLNRSLSSWG